MPFKALQIIEPILKALQEEWYSKPTPIQEQAIPIVLQKKDLLGCAQTGTGKTAAFALPIIQLLWENKTYDQRRVVKSLILTPTRELAIQIEESFRAYGRHTGVKCCVIFWGVSQHSQVQSLQRGVDVVIATPGRLLDLMQQKHISLKNVEIFVLDEADRMLDMGFIHDVKKVIAALPEKRQTLFFSATMPPEIVKLADTILKNPSKVTVTPVSSTVEVIEQSVFFVDKANKIHLLLEILANEKIKTVLVFTRTKHGADRVARTLMAKGITAEAIHGNKSQNNRQKALKNFKEQKTRVLIATDIAARGIDVDTLEYVINYELPDVPETYVHRIGRTGRAGAKGTAFAFCDAMEKILLRDIEKLIAKKIEINESHSFPMKDFSPAPAVSQFKGNNGRSGEGRQRSSEPRWHGKSKPSKRYYGGSSKWGFKKSFER